MVFRHVHSLVTTFHVKLLILWNIWTQFVIEPNNSTKWLVEFAKMISWAWAQQANDTIKFIVSDAATISCRFSLQSNTECVQFNMQEDCLFCPGHQNSQTGLRRTPPGKLWFCDASFSWNCWSGIKSQEVVFYSSFYRSPLFHLIIYTISVIGLGLRVGSDRLQLSWATYSTLSQNLWQLECFNSRSAKCAVIHKINEHKKYSRQHKTVITFIADFRFSTNQRGQWGTVNLFLPQGPVFGGTTWESVLMMNEIEKFPASYARTLFSLLV